MRKEVEIKIKGTIDTEKILRLGAEPLGHSHQHDTYLVSDHLMRVRQEGDYFLFTEKKYSPGKHARVHDVSERVIDFAESEALIKKHGVRLIICKHRTHFHFPDAIVALDHVEQLGDFIEISADSEDMLFQTMKMLDLDRRNAIKESYFELMAATSLSGMVRIAVMFHERVGELSFGITSGILTTIGVLVGVNAATSSRLSVIAAIAAIAVADSFSDAFAMYVSKKSERGFSKDRAFRHAISTFCAKFAFPLTFMVPFFFSMGLFASVLIDIAWGIFALALLSAEQALILEENIVKRIFCNSGLAMIIIVCSALAGSLIAKILG